MKLVWKMRQLPDKLLNLFDKMGNLCSEEKEFPTHKRKGYEEINLRKLCETKFAISLNQFALQFCFNSLLISKSIGDGIKYGSCA